jgi:hypothetical protein
MVLTNKQKFNKMYKQDKNQANSKEDISRLTKIPIKFLDEVYDRGAGAWETNPESVRRINGKKLSQDAWSYGRVYAFVVKRKEGTLDFDLDISSDIRKYQKKQREKKEKNN